MKLWGKAIRIKHTHKQMHGNPYMLNNNSLQMTHAKVSGLRENYFTCASELKRYMP